MIREENTIVHVERHWQFGGGGVWSGESRGLEGGVGVKRVLDLLLLLFNKKIR